MLPLASAIFYLFPLLRFAFLLYHPKQLKPTIFPSSRPQTTQKYFQNTTKKNFQKTLFCCSCGDDDDDESNHNSNSIYLMYKHLTKFPFRPYTKTQKNKTTNGAKRNQRTIFFFFFLQLEKEFVQNESRNCGLYITQIWIVRVWISSERFVEREIMEKKEGGRGRLRDRINE